VAGDGSKGFTGDGGQGTSAILNAPLFVAVDASGNIYMNDASNRRIRKVTKSTGIITTVAGDGTSTFKGDGGLATSAGLNYPRGIAVDASGNIYITDAMIGRVRMVTKSTGIITTVAGNGTKGYFGDGGPATLAGFYYPAGVAVDTLGNIYIADLYNGCIRLVTKSTGIITTVAGDGTSMFKGDGGLATSAKLNGPYGVAVDASGNIYIADAFSNRVRMVTKSTGIITTVAGDGKQVNSGDGKLATSASVYYPNCLAVDASGNIYVAATPDHRIRVITKSTGIISTVAGDGSEGYKGDGGPATSAGLHNPYGIAVDALGNLYIADQLNNRIRTVNFNGLAPTTPAPTPTPPSTTDEPTIQQTQETHYDCLDGYYYVKQNGVKKCLSKCRPDEYWVHKVDEQGTCLTCPEGSVVNDEQTGCIPTSTPTPPPTTPPTTQPTRTSSGSGPISPPTRRRDRTGGEQL
jgi:trimeric autotransporter adhesin